MNFLNTRYYIVTLSCDVNAFSQAALTFLTELMYQTDRV